MRELITTALEVVGLLLLAVALGVYLARFDTALGLAGAAAVLIAESFLVDALAGSSAPGDDA